MRLAPVFSSLFRNSTLLSCALVVGALAAPRAHAQAPAPTPAPDGATTAPAAAAPASTPAVDSAAPPAPPPSLTQQAFDIVEIQANTKANLEKAIGLYEQALKDPALPPAQRVAAYTDMSRAWMRIGDLEKGDATKLAAYGKGREAAQKAMSLDGKAVDAIFWDMANQACIGRTKGVMNSLFMLPELRKGLGRALSIDPGHKLAKQTLGEIDHAVPGLAGGSDDRAEKAYLEILKRDPSFTPTMVLLAKLYRDQGKDEEARKWAKKVLEGKSSTPNDWRKFDKAEAQKILKELDD